MIVDSHAHLVPPDLLAQIRKDAARFPSVKLVEEGGSIGFAFAGGKPTRPVAKFLTDIPGRVAWMQKQGIDKQVTAGWVDMFGYDIPGEEGEAWSRLINEHLAAAAKAEPRFVPLCTVPLGDGKRAAAVLKDAMKAGFPGAMIGTLPRGIGSVLDDSDLDAFWAAADETGAVIHIHPSFDAGEVRATGFNLPNALGRVTDAMIAVSRLLCTGHITKYKQAKFFVPIGGGGLPFVIGRLKHSQIHTPGVADPWEGLNLIYADTIVHDARILKFVIEMMGPDRVLMGSDSPFPVGDLEPAKIVDSLNLSKAQADGIKGGIAQQLFGIK